MDVDETEVDVEDIRSAQRRPPLLLLPPPRTGEDIAFRLIGCPECVEYS